MIRPLLSGEELQRYEADGFVALGPILDEDERLALLATGPRHRPSVTDRTTPVLADRHPWMVRGDAPRDPEPEPG